MRLWGKLIRIAAATIALLLLLAVSIAPVWLTGRAVYDYFVGHPFLISHGIAGGRFPDYESGMFVRIESCVVLTWFGLDLEEDLHNRLLRLLVALFGPPQYGTRRIALPEREEVIRALQSSGVWEAPSVRPGWRLPAARRDYPMPVSWDLMLMLHSRRTLKMKMVYLNQELAVIGIRPSMPSTGYLALGLRPPQGRVIHIAIVDRLTGAVVQIYSVKDEPHGT